MKTLGFIIGIIIAVTVHEFMHGYIANYLGDPTAKYQGRLTLNPIKHLDPLGMIFLLIIGFGWGRPVPVNPANFQNPRLGEFLTSIAGPLSNFVIAFIFAIILRIFPSIPYAVIINLIIYFNLAICVFNLLPVPPLDGSKIVWAIFPQINVDAFEQLGVAILFGLIFIQYLIGYSIIGSIILPIMSFLARVIGAPAALY
ncbi:MAG: site-2 protease family protein [Candidatus Berkelbacteria bacterium]|nr:site-2 protease family protein [Candidatus Berkelbacteria bacterium]